MSARTPSVAIVGAGIAGLVAAIELAACGARVRVFERAATAGGKMREVAVAGTAIDAGPTVFTMRWVFDEIFANAGANFADEVPTTPLRLLARHAWEDGGRLDLHADFGRSVAAIGDFAGAAEARRFAAFCARARRIYTALERPYLRAPQGGVLALLRRGGLRRLPSLARISPFATLWRALGSHFHDPRLRQLFGRYATYCGSSPFAAPATLMLIAHVEQDGVWSVDGGMQRLADALVRVARALGVAFCFDAHVGAITTAGGRASGIALSSGEHEAADAVIANVDVAALAAGRLGCATSVPPHARAARSLSAITFARVARTDGFPLVRHNVFFSNDYRAEFDALFDRRATPDAPTVYVCAQDRGDDAGAPATERLLCLVNAPATGDLREFGATEIDECEARMLARLARSGLRLTPDPSRDRTAVTTPADFERMFPGTGGALYGRATHGWRASFQRPGARSRLPRLYLAGGSTHPGPGVPMAALSGRQAAQCAIADLASTRR
ncbi:MAG: phytoene desaturase family protein [Burkholderiales bacterium]